MVKLNGKDILFSPQFHISNRIEQFKTCSIEFYEYIGTFNKVILNCVENGAVIAREFEGCPDTVENVLAGSLIVAIITDDYDSSYMDADFVPLSTDCAVVVPDDPDLQYVMYVANVPSEPKADYTYGFQI